MLPSTKNPQVLAYRDAHVENKCKRSSPTLPSTAEGGGGGGEGEYSHTKSDLSMRMVTNRILELCRPINENLFYESHVL